MYYYYVKSLRACQTLYIEMYMCSHTYNTDAMEWSRNSTTNNASVTARHSRFFIKLCLYPNKHEKCPLEGI